MFFNGYDENMGENTISIKVIWRREEMNKSDGSKKRGKTGLRVLMLIHYSLRHFQIV